MKTKRHAAPPPDMADMIEKIVDMANRNQAVMDGTMTPVLKIIADNEVVFGVWQDKRQRWGVGLLVIKGENWMREALATNRAFDALTSAVVCISAEQAEALRRHVATDPLH